MNTTGKIKYPPDPPRNVSSPPGNQLGAINNSNIVNKTESGLLNREESHTISSEPEPPGPRSVQDEKDLGPARDDTLQRAEPDSQAIQLGLPLPDATPERTNPGHGRSSSASRHSFDGSVINAAPPPVRPRRADDSDFTGNQQRDRSIAGTSSQVQPPRDQSGQTAPNGKLADRLSIVRTLPSSPVSVSDEEARRSNGTGPRDPPADAFYYGPRSPTGTTMSARGETPVQPLNRISEPQEAMRLARENLVLRAALEKASQDGPMPELQDVTTAHPDHGDPATTDALLSEVLRLQQQCSTLKVRISFVKRKQGLR